MLRSESAAELKVPINLVIDQVIEAFDRFPPGPILLGKKEIFSWDEEEEEDESSDRKTTVNDGYVYYVGCPTLQHNLLEGAISTVLPEAINQAVGFPLVMAFPGSTMGFISQFDCGTRTNKLPDGAGMARNPTLENFQVFPFWVAEVGYTNETLPKLFDEASLYLSEYTDTEYCFLGKVTKDPWSVDFYLLRRRLHSSLLRMTEARWTDAEKAEDVHGRCLGRVSFGRNGNVIVRRITPSSRPLSQQASANLPSTRVRPLARNRPTFPEVADHILNLINGYRMELVAHYFVTDENLYGRRMVTLDLMLVTPGTTAPVLHTIDINEAFVSCREGLLMETEWIDPPVEEH